MAAIDVDLEPQLKDVGKQLSHPLDSNDELLLVLDKLEKLLLKVDQSPKKSMLEALKPSINALIRDSLLKHSDMDVKVSVASCISEITRITAPDAPYTDDQMRDVFQLIVSSFEDLADRSSRSYSKRASILETVSKVRSCVIMLDLECDELIVKMFEHFLKSVRDYHLDAIYSSMENIMVLVIEESEEISVEMLKPLLASVKKDRVGVLPIAHKLGKDVLLKSADKLKPYMMPALTDLGESLDMYHKVVTAVCEGTAANFDDNDAEPQLANDCKLEKDSVDEAQQADESKVPTASSDHVDQVVKEEVSPKEEVDSTVDNKSPKSVMSNGVNETVKEPKAEDASVDEESKKLEEEESQEPVKKEDTADSDPDKLAKEVIKAEKEADTVMSSVEPSDSSHVDGDKEVEKDNDVKESETEQEKEEEKDDDVKQSEDQNEKDDVKDLEDKNEKDDVEELENQNEEDKDVKEPENQSEEEQDVKETENEAVESKPAATAQSNNVPDESSVPSEKEPAPQEVKTASPSKSGPTDKGLTQEDTPEAEKQEGKKTVIEKEVELADTVNKSEDDEASDSDAKPLKRSKAKPTKHSGKKSKQSGKKLETPAKKGEKGKIAVEEDEEDDSDDRPLKLSARKSSLKKKDDGKKRANSKNVAEKDQAKSLSEDDEMDVSPKPAVEEDDSDDKPLKQSGKRSKQSGKKLETPVKKGEKSKIEDEEDDSDDKPLKQTAKRSTSRKKNDGKRGNSKNVAEKDQAKSLSGDDEMDISPKSDKGEGNSTETPVTSTKRKRSTGKTEASDTIKYDESLIGKKVKVWWPEDKMYYEGVVSEFYPAKKKHKVSYVDGDEEKLNLRTQKWEILKEFSVRDDEEQNTEVQSDEGSPEIRKKKKAKSDPAASQEKIKDSAKKSSSKTKTVNKSNVKTPTTGNKSNGPSKAKSDAKEPEDVKSTENAKGGSKSGSKRKKRT